MSAVRGDESTGELISRLSTQTSELLRGEIRLAQAEITQKVRYAGFGAGAFGATVVLALAVVLPAWLAALVVTLALALLAGLLAVVGRKQVRNATPPVPERAVAGVREDVQTVKEARHHDRA